MARIAAALFVLALAGCATNPIPEGYTGPLARVTDTVVRHDSKKSDFYYVSEVDGARIEESAWKTREANYGKGFFQQPYTVSREAPARAMEVTLRAHTQYAAPILELLNPVYEVSGKVTFVPKPGGEYVVKGVLGEGYAAVWIEDIATGDVVTEKIENKL